VDPRLTLKHPGSMAFKLELRVTGRLPINDDSHYSRLTW
jgi:hypothetical protein